MMKHLLLFITTLVCSGIDGQQYIRKPFTSEQPDYASSFATSASGRYIGFSVGSEKSVLMDSAFNRLAEFTYDILWGGGGISFSYDEHYLAYKEYGDKQKVQIYNIRDKKTDHITINASHLEFYHTSPVLLISWNGHFSLYNYERKKLSKDVINVGESKGEFFASYCLAEHDSVLYTSTNKKTIEVYSTANWQKSKTFGPFPGEIENLRKSGNLLIFNIEQNIYTLNIQTGLTKNMEVSSSYVSDLCVSNSGEKVFIAGDSLDILALNLKDMSVEKVISNLENKQCFGIICLKNDTLLLGDYMRLVLYRKE